MSEKRGQIYDSILDAIGHTPVVKLKKLYREFERAEVVAKLEFLNPSGSIKDRMIRFMLEKASTRSEIIARVVENSSGNTGAALAMHSSVHDFDCIITLPDKTSREKIGRIQSYGARAVACPSDVPSDDPRSYYAVAERLAEENGAYYPNQYNSPLNAEAHFRDTGPEYWEQLEGQVDVLVCGIGSGGTISGVGRFMKEQNPGIEVVGAEPVGSVYQSAIDGTEYCDAPFDIEGVGKKSIPKSVDCTVIDSVVQVSHRDAIAYCHRLSREEGILAGGSSGLAACAVAKLLEEGRTGRIATIFPDHGVFYLSKYFDGAGTDEDRPA